MSSHRDIAVAALALLGTPVPARAQAQPDSAQTKVCWTGLPAPRCRVVVLTDFGAYVDVSSSAGRLFDDVGLMVNINGHQAVGASVLVDLNSEAGIGPELRFRSWQSGGNALDFALGVRGPIAGVDHGAVIGLVRYGFGPYLALALRPQLVRRETPPNVWPVTQPVSGWGLGLSIGVEIGSWPGAAAAAAVGLMKLGNFLSHGPSIQLTGLSSPKW